MSDLYTWEEVQSLNFEAQWKTAGRLKEAYEYDLPESVKSGLKMALDQLKYASLFNQSCMDAGVPCMYSKKDDKMLARRMMR